MAIQRTTGIAAYVFPGSRGLPVFLLCLLPHWRRRIVPSHTCPGHEFRSHDRAHTMIY